MKDAIRKGIEECGVVDSFARLIEAVQKSHGGPGDLLARVEALEFKADQHQTLITAHQNRLERHRLRIRWLERWAHSHWLGFFSRPGL